MAQSIEIIEQRIIDDKNSNSTLSVLNEVSKGSVWRSWCYIVAVVNKTFSDYFDSEIQRVENKINANYVGTDLYLQRMMLNQQVGDQILLNDNFEYYYEFIDVNKKLITRCAISSDVSKQVLLKLAKGTTNLEPLTSTELSQAQVYIDKIGIRGVNYICFSADSDKIEFSIKVYHKSSENIITLTENAILDYLSTNANELNFGGDFYIAQFINSIIDIKDVLNVSIEWLKINDTYLIQNYVQLQPSYKTKSGYIEFGTIKNIVSVPL